MRQRKTRPRRAPVDEPYADYFAACYAARLALVAALAARYKTDEQGAVNIIKSAAELAYFPGRHDVEHVAAAIGATRDQLDAALVDLGILPPTPPPATAVH